MNGYHLTKNAIMAVVQVIVSGVVLFLLYRYLLRTIGTEQMGLWAVVLATASASRISELGFTGSAVKYTAKYIARGEKDKAAEVVQTTAITIAVILACVLAVSYPLIVWVMEQFIPPTHIPGALTLLPYALVSIWIGTVAAVFLSGLDGCQRIDLRVLVTILASALLLLLTWILVPRYGLVGLACAQIGQGLLLLCGGWVLLRRQLLSLPLFPVRWNYALFREMFRYGFNFQVISIAGMLFDPMTKALMVKFGGLSSTAYYEMASRMVMQFRSLLVSANQVMVPQIADLHENSPDTIREAYLNSYRIIFYFALPLYFGVAAITPLVCELWVGHFERSFVGYALLLAVGYGFNTLIGPAYFVNLGTGLLRLNLLSNVAIGILNPVLGYGLGALLAGEGVALGYVLSLVIGSGILVVLFHRDHRIPLAELLPRESRKLFFVCCASLLLGYGVFYILMGSIPPLWNTCLVLAVCAIPASALFWMHPLRKSTFATVTSAFQRTSVRGA